MSHETNLATLSAALEPSRVGYTSAIYAILRPSVDRVLANLAAHGNDARKAAPYPSGNLNKIVYHAALRTYHETRKWTKSARPEVCLGMNDADIRIPMTTAQIDAGVMKIADAHTSDDFSAYAHKLAGKVGQEIESASVRGQLWACSTLHVVCVEHWKNDTAESCQQVWSTKMILNRSVLGKLFNQWPTRRVS